jgi:hypothetical protein
MTLRASHRPDRLSFWVARRHFRRRKLQRMGCAHTAHSFVKTLTLRGSERGLIGERSSFWPR